MAQDPYLNAFLRLAGHENFQRFEAFCVVLARLRWPGRLIRRTSDKEAVFDILVHDADNSSTVVAQIEAKASSRMAEITTLTDLKKLVREWKPDELHERLAKAGAHYSSCSDCILATTAPVKPGLWESKRDSLGFPTLKLWDAHRLATFAANDARIATYLDTQLPNADPLLADVELNLIVANNSSHQAIGVANIEDVLLEKDGPKALGLSRPVLVYGPPNVGKTCFAVRQAWTWSQEPDRQRWAFVFNARWRSPDDPKKVVAHIPWAAEALIVVDDVHFSDDIPDWVRGIERARNTHEKLLVVWVSRDGDVIEKLASQILGRPDPYPYPVDRVVSLYMDRLQQYPQWQRVLAAFETRVNPRLAKLLAQWSPATGPDSSGVNKESFRMWLARHVAEDARRRQLKNKEDLGDAAYSVYLALLPFGSLGASVHEGFLTWLGLDATTAVEKLRAAGLGFRSTTGLVTLTEHPFQVRETLRAIDSTTYHPAVSSRLERELAVNETVPLSTGVLACYLAGHEYTDRLAIRRITTLGDFAEWSGVREPLARALQFLVNRVWIEDTDVRGSAITWHRKLARTSFPEPEDEFNAMLRDAEAYWISQRVAAESAADRKSHGVRLDTILYELAYIRYLRGQYEEARDVFSESVDAGLEVITNAMTAGPRDSVWPDAKRALSHIWISALLTRASDMRACLRAWVEGDQSERLLARLRQDAAEVAQIYDALASANRTIEALSGEVYLHALDSIRPGWRRANTSGTHIIRREDDMATALGRHELNAWAHSREAACWPRLYGIPDSLARIPLPRPMQSYSTAFPAPAPSVGLPAYGQRKVNLLVGWSNGTLNPSTLAREAISVTALTLAGGGFEYIGDLILLALNGEVATEVRELLEWYLLHRVPSVGCNELPKMFLQRASSS